MSQYPVCMTIAGSDPSGGAGLQADLKVFHQHGVFGTSAVTLITVQNSKEVKDVRVLDGSIVAAQIEAILDDLSPAAAKTGALGSAEVIDAVAYYAKRFEFPLVVDPVLLSKHNAALLPEEAVEFLIRSLLPHTYLVTPNIEEASRLAEMTIRNVKQMEAAARTISLHGPRRVLIKGGHLSGNPTDVLYSDGELYSFPGDRVETPNTHGTGCVFSAALTAKLAYGTSLLEATKSAKQFVTQAIKTNPGLGKGFGPVNMFVGIS